MAGELSTVALDGLFDLAVSNQLLGVDKEPLRFLGGDEIEGSLLLLP